ncbi:hypothetical protein KCU99_g8496, partial [Aureobasidium melanogenum]
MRRNNLLLALAAGAVLAAAQNNAQTTAAGTTKASSAASTAAPTTDKLTGVSSFVKSSSQSSAAASSTTDSTKTSASKTSSGASSTTVSQLTDLPTLAGATVPDMVIPYTADAPFMQKSNVPEGTVFIAVGACLAFLGACVLAWRAMVAWSINRSVKRAAMASVMASDAKTKYGPGGNLYAMPQGSSLSLDALTSAGKPLSSAGLKKENRKSTQPTADPSSLFFSPTAGQRNSSYMPINQNRSSTYLPAGYYATPGAQAAGGRDSMVMGGAPSLQPTGHRYSRAEYSPPSSRDGSRPRSSVNPHSHQRTGSNAMLSPTHQLYAQPSTSSLAVGFGAQADDGSNVSSSNLPGQRAPSAYFDDVLHEHGNGPRERY